MSRRGYRLLIALCFALVLLLSCALVSFASDDFTVIIQDADGSVLLTYSGLSAESTSPRPTEPIKAGKVFYGWLYSTDGVTFSSDLWDFGDPVGGNLILRASYRDAFSGGSGVYYDPYLLKTAEDLHLLSHLYSYNTDLSRQTTYFSMENDIVLNADLLTDGVPRTDAIPFRPIGSATKSFRGFFDGNGHTIYGLYIDLPTTDYVGLFATLGSNTIGTPDISIADSYVRGRSYVGLLAGQISNTPTLSSGTLSGVVFANGDNAGGLCGWLDNTSVSRYTAEVAVTGRDNVGGIAGCGGVSSFFDRCEISGSISGRSYVGGIAGYTAGTMILGGSCDAEIFASVSHAGGAAGIMTALPYDIHASALSDFHFSGKVTTPLFVSPFIGLCTPSDLLTARLTQDEQAAVTGENPAFWFADSLHVYAVVMSADGIPYYRSSLLSFVLHVSWNEIDYRFATTDLIPEGDTSTAPIALSHVQSTTGETITLLLPCGSEQLTIRFTFTAIGSDVLIGVATPSLPANCTATIAFGTSYRFYGTDAAASFSKLNGSHAGGAYATSERELISCSFSSIQAGVASDLALCGTQLTNMPTSFLLPEASSASIGIYGCAALSSSPAYALVSYRTKAEETPILLPVLQSTAVAGSTEKQVTFGGGFYLLLNGATGTPQASHDDHVRLSIPSTLTEDTLLPLAVLLDAHQTAGITSISVTFTMDGKTVTVALPVITVSGTSDLVTPVPTIQNNTIVTLPATEIYGFAPNNTLMGWEIVDGTATCTRFPVGGTYWCILPTANGFYSVAELPLYVVTYTTPYITTPTNGIVDMRAPVALAAPQVFPIAGYTFEGWYQVGATTPFDFSAPITASIAIEGRWSLHTVTITTQPTAQSKVFSPTIPATLTLAFDHARAPELTFTFAWYYAASAEGTFQPLAGETRASLERFHVVQSGFYYAEITATDGISTSVTRTETVAVSITPLAVGLPVVSLPDGFPYTGYPISVTFTDPYAYRTVSGGIQTNLGSYTAIVELTSSTDYVWESGITTPVTVQWSIVKRKVALPAILGSYTYNGQAQAPVLTTHPDYTATTVSGTLAGSYPITFTLVDPAHCVWENGTNTPYQLQFVIAPRTPVLTIYNGTKHYDGNPISAYAITDSTAAITLSYYKDGTLLSTPPTEPGSYTVLAQVAAVAGQYAAAEVTHTITITPAVYTVLWDGLSVTYNGETRTPAYRLLLGGTLVQDMPSCTLVCTEPAILPGSYTYTLVLAEDTPFATLANNTCTLTIAPKQVNMEAFPSTLIIVATGAPLSPDLTDYLPEGVAASIAPLPQTAGIHRVLVSFTVPTGYEAPTPRELSITVLASTHASADGNAWLTNSEGFATNNLPQILVGNTSSISLPDHDSATLYVVRGANGAQQLSFAGSARMEVYLVTSNGELTLCTTEYDATAGCATLSAADGSYLIIDHDPFSPLLLVLLLGVGTTALVCAIVYGVPYLRRRSAK